MLSRLGECHMDLNQYVKDAVRTENQIEKVTLLDSETFAAALQIFIRSGQILDMFKKNIFYGKPIDWECVESKLGRIEMDSGAGFANRKTDLEVDPRMFHALIGTATEAAELMEALLAYTEGEGLDIFNVLEEFGDINWYEAIAIDASNGELEAFGFEDVLSTNIEKLRKRFPDKFTNEKAIKRDLDVERNTLQAGLTKVS